MSACLGSSDVVLLASKVELVLYAPYFAFAVTWVLGFIHYDWALFLSNLLINYVSYVAMQAIAPALNWRTTVIDSTSCTSEIYQNYIYYWPCSSCSLWIAFGIVLFVHHLSRRRLWWPTLVRERRWWLVRRTIFVLTLAVPPIFHAAFLLATGMQSGISLALNWFSAFVLTIAVRTIIPSEKVAYSVWAHWRDAFGLPASTNSPEVDEDDYLEPLVNGVENTDSETQSSVGL